MPGVIVRRRIIGAFNTLFTPEAGRSNRHTQRTRDWYLALGYGP